MKLEDYVIEIKEDVKELKEKVDELLIFMAVQKEQAKRTAVISGGVVSIIVSVAVIAAEKYIKG